MSDVLLVASLLTIGIVAVVVFGYIIHDELHRIRLSLFEEDSERFDDNGHS